MSNEKESSPKLRSKDFGIRDFLVDFLGALFPGLIFGVAIALTLGSTMVYLIHQSKILLLDRIPGIEDINTLDIIRYLSEGLGNYSFYIFMLVIITSYILGQFLYRKDPKDPDTASFKRVWKRLNSDQQEKWVEQLKPEENISTFTVEFPYRFLRKYLESRGLLYLTEIVPWTEEDHSFRSKTFINKLKIRLQCFHPDKTGDILKNEGHIRLMSSIWHMFRYLKQLSIGCIIINILLFALIHQTVLYLIVPLLLSVLVFLLAYIGKRGIETFFHYQRVREVYYVLETAYAAFMDNKERIIDKVNKQQLL